MDITNRELDVQLRLQQLTQLDANNLTTLTAFITANDAMLQQADEANAATEPPQQRGGGARTGGRRQRGDADEPPQQRRGNATTGRH